MIPAARDFSYRVEGTGFLYKQVRGMVGAMCHLAQNDRQQRPPKPSKQCIAQGRERPV